MALILCVALFCPIALSQTLRSNEIFIDDYQIDELNAVDGWSSSQVVYAPDDAATPTLHGWFDTDRFSLRRYFDIDAFAAVTIEFTFIWGCNPSTTETQAKAPKSAEKADPTYDEYATLTYGDESAPSWTREDSDVYVAIDDALFVHPQCNDQVETAFAKDVSFTQLVAPQSQYLVSITNVFESAVSWQHFWGVSNFKISTEPICDLSPFLALDMDVDLQTIKEYLNTVTDADCQLLLQQQVDDFVAAKAAELEQYYEIAILAGSNSNADDIGIVEGGFFNVVPLTPNDLAAFDGHILVEEDVELIADLFDVQLNSLMLSTNTLVDDQETWCSKFQAVHGNIANFQRRILLEIDPVLNANYSRSIARDSFSSMAARINADVDGGADDDVDFELRVSDDVLLRIPYVLIRQGRSEWREFWDSIDVIALGVDRIWLDECQSFAGEFYADVAVSVDLYADAESKSFSFVLPSTVSESDGGERIACGWIENEDDDWQTDGCELVRDGETFTCKCDHQTVFSLVQDLRTGAHQEMDRAIALQDNKVYLAFCIAYTLLATVATYMVVTLYMIKERKKFATIIIGVIALQIYFHMLMYMYLSMANLSSIPLGVTFCLISLPLLLHFWVCSLLIMHWLKIFEIAKAFDSTDAKMDYFIVVANIVISVIFVALLLSAMLVKESALADVVAAANGFVGIIGICICMMWFYCSFKTSNILLSSANRVKDACSSALDETLGLRKRLMRLTFLIGTCLLIQSVIAVLSMFEELQLFHEHFVNFNTIWAICDLCIFVTWVFFYRMHVRRQRQLYILDQQERERERRQKRKSQAIRASPGALHAVAPPMATEGDGETSHGGFFHRLSELRLPRISLVGNARTRSSTFNSTAAKSAPGREKSETATVTANSKHGPTLTATASTSSNRMASVHQSKKIARSDTVLSEEYEHDIEVHSVRSRFSVASNTPSMTNDDSTSANHQVSMSVDDSVLDTKKGKNKLKERVKHNRLSVDERDERSNDEPKATAPKALKRSKARSRSVSHNPTSKLSVASESKNRTRSNSPAGTKKRHYSTSDQATNQKAQANAKTNNTTNNKTGLSGKTKTSQNSKGSPSKPAAVASANRKRLDCSILPSLSEQSKAQPKSKKADTKSDKSAPNRRKNTSHK